MQSYVRWFEQAQYDLDTADVLFNNERYFYAVFMCHLALEKALKGIFQQRLKVIPPKTHNLIYLLNKIDIKPPEPLTLFFITLNEANVATRYPEDIRTVSKEYPRERTMEIISQSKECFDWIKTQL